MGMCVRHEIFELYAVQSMHCIIFYCFFLSPLLAFLILPLLLPLFLLLLLTSPCLPPSLSSDLFSINSFNGILTLESPLDYETPEDRYFNFTLTVTDRGSPQMSDSAIVFVYVTDSNDNDPEFINGVSGAITIEIPEGNYTQPQLLFDVRERVYVHT